MKDYSNNQDTVYIGVDLHRHYSTVVRKNHQGKLIAREHIYHTPDHLEEFARSLNPSCKVAVEATGNWAFFFETVESSGAEVKLCHPLKTRAIASAKIMTDRLSAEILADLLRADLLPPAYIPDRETRDLRELLRYRAALVALATQVRCRLRAVLAKNGLRCPHTDILGEKSRRFLNTLALRPVYQLETDSLIQVGRALLAEIERLQEIIDQQAELDERARLLDTIPGVGSWTALLILAEIGDINRFPTAGHLASYAGLVPSVHSSGGRTRLGHITRQGSKWLRWVLVECWWKLINKSLAFRMYYERIRLRHGAKVARVAVARKLAHVIYRMLKDGVPFSEKELLSASS